MIELPHASAQGGEANLHVRVDLTEPVHPLQLVPGGGSKYKAAPQVFGSVMSQPEFSLKRNHFLTLEFTAPSAQRASMLVRFWPIIRNGMPLQSQIIGNKAIELI